MYVIPSRALHTVVRVKHVSQARSWLIYFSNCKDYWLFRYHFTVAWNLSFQEPCPDFCIYNWAEKHTKINNKKSFITYKNQIKLKNTKEWFITRSRDGADILVLPDLPVEMRHRPREHERGQGCQGEGDGEEPGGEADVAAAAQDQVAGGEAADH